MNKEQLESADFLHLMRVTDVIVDTHFPAFKKKCNLII